MVPNSCIFLTILILFTSIVTGCAKSQFPTQKDNILTQSVKIEMPATVKSRAEVIEDVMTGLDSYYLDDFGKTKAINVVNELYDQEFSDSTINKRIKVAIANALSSNDTYDSWLLVNGKPLNAKAIKTSKETLNNLTMAITFATWNQFSFRMGNETYTPNATVYLEFAQTLTGSNITADISTIRYLIDCSYSYRTTGGSYSGGPYRCGHLDGFQIKDDILVNIIKRATSSPKSISDFRRNVIDSISKRFVGYSAKADKTIKTYNVDFITAKARLQRALGAFKFDPEKSTFTLEKTYQDPIKNNSNKIVKHRFVLALFPDRNSTVVEFDGDYNYFKDLFGGPDKYGKTEYSQENNLNIKKVNSLLTK
jgi:hypothetical protein